MSLANYFIWVEKRAPALKAQIVVHSAKRTPNSTYNPSAFLFFRNQSNVRLSPSGIFTVGV